MPTLLVRRAPRAALLAVLAAQPLLARPLPSQPPAPPSPPPPAAAPPTPGPRPGALVAGITPGVRVRIAVPGGRVEGRAGGTAGDTLLVRASGGVYRAPEAAIDSLWLRDGRAVGRGALVGGGLGAVALGGFALFLTQALCDRGSGCDVGRDERNAVLAAGAIGAAGGAAAGALIGALIPDWRRVRP